MTNRKAPLWILSFLPLLSPVSAADCRPIDGVLPLLRPGRVILLGELHGTAESPAFALDVACHAAAAGLPVVVGLELPTREQPRVDRFLESGGTARDRAELLAGSIWQGDYQDGRASQAMADLIDGVRELRLAGAAARVVLFDAPNNRGGQVRDRAMGHTVAAAALESSRAVLIALTGNMHSRITLGRPRDADYEPLGHVVAGAIAADRLVALDVAHGGGSAWICAPECGIQDIGGRRGDRRWTVEVDEDTRPAGHHGWYFVGELHASPPARLGTAAEPLVSSADVANDTVPPAAGPSAPTAEGAAAAVVDAAVETPLSPAEQQFQGVWQAYDYTSDSRAWKMRFDGRRFRADGGADDWYEGRIAIRDDRAPAMIDFTIEDCRCDFKGETSAGIYTSDDGTIVIAAPRPGNARPTAFQPSRGDMLRLRPLRPDDGTAAGR